MTDVTPPTTDTEPATEAEPRKCLRCGHYIGCAKRCCMYTSQPCVPALAAERASGGLNRMALAAAIQVVGLPMRYVHRIIDAYDRATPQPGEPE